MLEKKCVFSYIDFLKNNDTELNNFFSLLEDKSKNFYIIGGVLRDLYIKKEKSYDNIRDVDIIVEKIDFKYLEERYNYKKNRFGGYKFYFKKVEVDLWDFKENWAFKEKIVEDKRKLKKKLKNLSKGAFFNLDSLVMDYKKQRIEGELFYKALENYELDFTIKNYDLLKLNPTPEVNVIRAIINARKYKLELSRDIVKYISKYLETSMQTIDIYNAQIKHYGKEIIAKEDLEIELKKILQNYKDLLVELRMK